MFHHDVVDFLDLLDRHQRPVIEDALSDTPAVLLVSARQTGKTTLARLIADRHPGGAYRTRTMRPFSNRPRTTRKGSWRAFPPVRGPKVHVLESGVAALAGSLAGLGAEALERDRHFLGPLLESFVAGELRRGRSAEARPVARCSTS